MYCVHFTFVCTLFTLFTLCVMSLYFVCLVLYAGSFLYVSLSVHYTIHPGMNKAYINFTLNQLKCMAGLVRLFSAIHANTSVSAEYGSNKELAPRQRGNGKNLSVCHYLS